MFFKFFKAFGYRIGITLLRENKIHAKPSINQANSLLEKLANHYSVSVDDIKGKSKETYIKNIRWHAIMELQEMGFYPTAIGRIINRDHSTVLHAIKTIQSEEEVLLKIKRFRS